MPTVNAYGKIYRFPDGTTEAQITEAIMKEHGQSTSPAPKVDTEPYAPERNKGILSNLIGGAVTAPIEVGKGLLNLQNGGELSPLTTTLGGMAGGTPGAFVGSVAGQAAEQMVQGHKPNPLGIIGNALGDVGANYLLDKGMRSGANAFREFQNQRASGQPLSEAVKESTFKTLFPTHTQEVDTAAIAGYQDKFKPTVGQATGSPFANFIEGAFAKTKKLARQKEQSEAVTSEIDRLRKTITGSKKPTSESQRGETAQNLILSNRSDVRSREKAAYDLTQNIKNKNVVDIEEVVGKKSTGIIDPNTGQPMEALETKTRSIAPVELNQTVGFAVADKLRLDDIFNETKLQSLPPFLQRRYSQAKQALDDVLRPVNIIDSNGQPSEVAGLRDYDTAVKARSEIGKIVFDKPEVNYTDQDRILLRIYNSLGKDIENSVKKWPNGGGDMQLALSEANKITRQKFETFNTRVMGAVKRNRTESAYPSEFYDKAFKNQDSAREFLTALGDDKPAKKEMAGAYFETLLKDAVNTADGKFYPDKIIHALKDIDSPAKVVFTARQQSTLENFARAVRVISDKDSGAGQVALRIREGSFALNAASGLLTAAGEQALTSGTKRSLLGTAILIGARPISNTLLNEKNAALATRLTKIKPDTPEAKFAARALLLSMKGEQVKLNIPNVGIFDATINNEGKVQPLFNTENQ